jgi:hypothetical protein
VDAASFTIRKSRVFSAIMPNTSLTVLDSLRRPNQPDAWNRFARLSAPLLLEWATAKGFQNADAEDLVQTVLIKLIRLLLARKNARVSRSAGSCSPPSATSALAATRVQ